MQQHDANNQHGPAAGAEIDMNQVNDELGKAGPDEAAPKDPMRKPKSDKVDWDKRHAELEHENLNPSQSDDVDEALAAILEKNRKGAALYEQKMRNARWILRIWLFVSTVGLFALLGAVGWTYRDRVVQDWDRYDSPTSKCVFKVGDRTVHGGREKSYRYYTVFGWRFYDTRTVQEKTYIELPSSAASVLAHMADGSYQKVSTTDGENGRYPLPQADSYSFFMDGGKNSAVITYRELCK